MISTDSAARCATLIDVLDEQLLRIFEISHYGYPHGRPGPDHEDADVWLEYMREVLDPDDHPLLWDVAYSDSTADPTAVATFARQARRLRLHTIIDATRTDPARADELATSRPDLLRDDRVEPTVKDWR